MVISKAIAPLWLPAPRVKCPGLDLRLLIIYLVAIVLLGLYRWARAVIFYAGQKNGPCSPPRWASLFPSGGYITLSTVSIHILLPLHSVLAIAVVETSWVGFQQLTPSDLSGLLFLPLVFLWHSWHQWELTLQAYMLSLEAGQHSTNRVRSQ